MTFPTYLGELPLVTVVVPCYNHECYVERAIRSVIDQTYKNIQLVVIDDGSQDGSVIRLRELSKNYGFELICQENRGVCRTLNRAIQECGRGLLVAILASDDYWHPEKIERQVTALKANPASEFCFSQAIEFDDEEHAEQGRIFPKRVVQGNVLNSVFVRTVPAGSIIFSRRLYDVLGGFDDNLPTEDWDFVIRSAAATQFVGLPIPLLYYRSHAGNTRKTRDRAVYFHCKLLTFSKNFLLVDPWRWLFVVCLHFAHDIVIQHFFRGRRF